MAESPPPTSAADHAEDSALLLAATAHANRSALADTTQYGPIGGVRRNSVGWAVVALQQSYGGVPVLDGVRAVRFDDHGAFVTITGAEIEVVGSVPVVPSVSPEEAARIGFLELARKGLVPSGLMFSADAPEVVTRMGEPGGTAVLTKEPVDGPIIARLVLDTSRKHPALTWEISLRLPGAGGGFVIRVEASGSGLPEVRDIERSSSHAITASVFEFDPRGAPDAVDLPLPDGSFFDWPSSSTPARDWVWGGETRGRNVEVLTNGRRVRAQQGQHDLHFEAQPPLGLEAAAINAFYLCNFLHDFFYRLGFTPANGNFEAEGAAGDDRGDPLTVLIQSNELRGMAFFDSRTDGKRPFLELGPHPSGRHTAFDSHLVIHEYVHGVTNRIVGEPHGLHTPLRHQQSVALGEGLSDYWAITIRNHYRRRAARDDGQDPLTSEEWCFAPWLAGTADGLRTQPYDEHDGTYGFIRGRRMKAHRAGEVWCATLLDLHQVLGAGDPERGDEACWPLVFDALTFLHPGRKGPTFLHARDAVLCTFDLHVEHGRLDEGLRGAVLDVFRNRGMGGDAESDGGRYRNAEEGDGPIGDDYRRNCRRDA